MGRRPEIPPTSEGGRLLRATPGNLRSLAKQIGRAHATVASWITTEARPSGDDRRKMAALLSIPARAWDMPPGGAVPPSEPRGEPTTESPGRSLDEAMRQMMRAAKIAAHLIDQELFDEALKWSEQERKATELVAKLRGDLSPADETRLTQTPRWASIRTVIVDALRKHPEARSDVIRALREIEAMGREET